MKATDGSARGRRACMQRDRDLLQDTAESVGYIVFAETRAEEEKMHETSECGYPYGSIS